MSIQEVEDHEDKAHYEHAQVNELPQVEHVGWYWGQFSNVRHFNHDEVDQEQRDEAKNWVVVHVPMQLVLVAYVLSQLRYNEVQEEY